MDLPLIAVPRLLVQYHGLNGSTRSKRLNNPSECPRGSQGSHLKHGPAFDDHENYLDEMRRLLPLSLLDFPAELIANSMVCLWNDMASEDSRADFLRFQKAWMQHAVLLACLSGNAVELVKRLIEIACFLDLLCQQHTLAATIVEALKSKSISRLTIWENVPTPLAHNMDEIISASLAPPTPSEPPFRAPRDVSLEYWLLTRPFVSDDMLLAESRHVQPKIRSIGDVENRIDQLEALVSAMNDEDGTEEIHFNGIDTAANAFVSESSDVESLHNTDTGDSDFCSSEPELPPKSDVNSAYHLALQTKERVSRELECIKDKIHRKASKSVSDVGSLGTLTQKSEWTIDPLDQKTIFQIGAHLKNDVHQRRYPHSTTHRINRPGQDLVS